MRRWSPTVHTGLSVGGDVVNLNFATETCGVKINVKEIKVRYPSHINVISYMLLSFVSVFRF